MLRCPGTPDPEVERRAVVVSFCTTGELAPDSPLIVGRALQRRGERRVVCSCPAPTLDAAGGFESRKRRDEVRAREVVRRRERLAAQVVRSLLGDRGQAERTANDDAEKRAWLSPKL